MGWPFRIDALRIPRSLAIVLGNSFGHCADLAVPAGHHDRAFHAGSASDTVGRILAARLSELLGQQVIIENIGGAGGMTGTARVANAARMGISSSSAAPTSLR